jgi:Zn-dependent protease
MQGLNSIFYVLVLIMSVVVHEVAHGFAAEAYGDPTARYAGRLTLNPLKHIDPVGSILLPFLMIAMHAGFVIGWAKPVPYSEHNLRDKKRGTLAVASAGILANICLALIFGISIRFAGLLGAAGPAYVSIAQVITVVNLLLALFNLIPIPPLDGSKILFTLLPARAHNVQQKLQRLALPLLLVFVVFVWPLVFPLISYAFLLITGTML